MILDKPRWIRVIASMCNLVLGVRFEVLMVQKTSSAPIRLRAARPCTVREKEDAMTMPSERTRTLIQTRDFLVELVQDPPLFRVHSPSGPPAVTALSQCKRDPLGWAARRAKSRPTDRALPELQY